MFGKIKYLVTNGKFWADGSSQVKVGQRYILSNVQQRLIVMQAWLKQNSSTFPLSRRPITANLIPNITIH